MRLRLRTAPVIVEPRGAAQVPALVGDLADFKQIAAMLHADSGIFLAQEKMSLVYGRLIRHLRAP